MTVKIKLIISVTAFVVGSVLAVTPALTKDNFEFLLPGIVLVVASVPPMYYFYAKAKSGYWRQSDEEILNQAKLESKLSEKGSDGKK